MRATFDAECGGLETGYKDSRQMFQHSDRMFEQIFQIPGGGGGLSYEEYTGVCHELGSYFQEKIPKRVCQFFTKIPQRVIISVRNSR